MISPYARENYVDHSITDQASIVRFIEGNWNLGRLGNGSADAKAGTLDNMFDFNLSNGDFHGATAISDNRQLILNPNTGEAT